MFDEIPEPAPIARPSRPPGPPPHRECVSCGVIFDGWTEACPSCLSGHVTERVLLAGIPDSPRAAYISESGKERWVAMVLAIFLGSFGAHKFYLGQTRKGLLYLAFCWTIIPGLVGLFEGISYLGMSDQDFEASLTR